MPINLKPERQYGQQLRGWAEPFGLRSVRDSFVSYRLRRIASRQAGQAFSLSALDDETAAYALPLIDVFRTAAKSYPSISIDPEVMGGAPCISGTRIPVYMILDAIECNGTVESALRSYSRLTIQQVQDAIGFAKLIVECPIEHETSPAS
jgi:uncharacterized protein (DUF433 family)